MRASTLTINRNGRYEAEGLSCFPASYGGYPVTVSVHPETISDLTFAEGDLEAAFERIERELLIKVHEIEAAGGNPGAQTIIWADRQPVV